MTSQLLSHWRAIVRIAAALTGLTWSKTAQAAVFGGSSIQEGILAAAGIGGISADSSIVSVIITIITVVLFVVTTVAVAVVVVAGLYLIFSGGDEGQKDKAKKIIIYCLVGLVVILMARVAVTFVNNIL